MSGAYREGLAVRRTALGEVLWRRRVGTAATWLFGLLVADFGASVLSGPAHRHAWAAVLVALSVAEAFAVWRLTAPRPGKRASSLGWLLRAAAIAVPLAEVGYFLTRYWTPVPVFTFVVEVAGMAYVARLFDHANAPASARDARLLAVPLAAGPYIAFWFPTIADWAALGVVGCVGWTGILLFRLRGMLHVADDQWWFDNGAEAPGAWVSLLRYGDGCAEVVHADGQRTQFTSRADGEQWLEQHGYIPAERALDEHLVTSMPPRVLMAARSRKWLRSWLRARTHIDQPPIVGTPGSRGLRYWFRPADHHSWFNKQTETAGEWALLVLRENQAEVHRIDEKLAFPSGEQAVEWLEGNGYVPDERAIRDGLASDAPPNPTKESRTRKPVHASAASQKPRVRIAADAPGREPPEPADGIVAEDDEIDEDAAVNTLHEAAPPRAAAVEDPHNPRH